MYAQAKLPTESVPEDFLESLVRRARRMTAEERLQALVRAGVYTPEGKLAERFRRLAEEDPRD